MSRVESAKLVSCTGISWLQMVSVVSELASHMRPCIMVLMPCHVTKGLGFTVYMTEWCRWKPVCQSVATLPVRSVSQPGIHLFLELPTCVHDTRHLTLHV